MGLRIDKLVPGNIVDHKHKAEDLLSSALVDTKANILATTPSESGKLAYSTDTNEFYLYDGSNWVNTDEPTQRYSFMMGG